jgi:tRNA pseudouridine55 synthase
MVFDFLKGELLLIDKPLEWTSFDAVNKIRRIIEKQIGAKLKVGHAGTLDPKATGLLLICTGAMTKQIVNLTGLDKEYTGTFFIGATTPCYDTEKPVDRTFPTDHITEEMVRNAAKKFTGTIQQVPPTFSAKLIDGKRAYLSARKNKEIKMEPVTVTISEFEITRIALPEIGFRVVCSKGTYIRALARDFGEELGSGGYLASLRRTRVGEYWIEDALNIEQFEIICRPGLPTS